MSIGKDAAIASSHSAPFGGKPPPKPVAPPPRAKTPTSPGLGAKMRSETSQAIEQMLKKGGFETGLEGLLKAAAAAAMPTARIVRPGSGVRTPVTPAPAPPAGATPLPAQPHPLVEAARGLPNQAWGAVKRPLALGALGLAGAAAYGMHRQNVEDHENNPLVYSPLPGSAMG